MGNKYAGYNPQGLGEERDRLLEEVKNLRQALSSEPVAWLIGGEATSRRWVMEAAKKRGVPVTPLYSLARTESYFDGRTTNEFNCEINDLNDAWSRGEDIER